MDRILSILRWQTKEGSISIKNMDTEHIKRVRNYIEKSNNEKINDISKTAWLLALNTELTYRVTIGNVLLREVDKQSIIRNAINNCLRPEKYGTKSITKTW